MLHGRRADAQPQVEISVQKTVHRDVDEGVVSKDVQLKTYKERGARSGGGGDDHTSSDAQSVVGKAYLGDL